MITKPNFEANLLLGGNFTLFAFNGNEFADFDDARFKGAFALAAVSTTMELFTALNAAVRTDAMLNSGLLKFVLADTDEAFDIGRVEVHEMEKFEKDPDSFVDLITNLFNPA